ncbi:MAG TPA: AAA family ATPase [Nitrospiraceae bacterium]
MSTALVGQVIIPSDVTTSLPGFNAMLIGPTGTGKTTSLKTLVDTPGLEVFAVFTEPRYDMLGTEILNKIHYRYIAPTPPKWTTMIDTARLINKLSNDALQKMNSISGSEYAQYVDVLMLFNNFVDQHGMSFGDVSTWGTNRVLWIDGLTGINKMIRGLRVGSKPVLTQPDWGVMMAQVQNFVDAVVCGTYCHVVLVTHVEREIDEVTGASHVMVSTLGRKLAPLLPTNFGDVILAKKEGTKFSWSTAEINVSLKGAFLPNQSELAPSFVPLLNAWKAKGGVLGINPPANWQNGEGA